MLHSAKPPVLAIVGPTASGKTALSVHLAQHFHGEVISADSRQVYRGLDIGTAKVTEAEMAGVPHHLIDCVEIDTIYTAHDFAQDASSILNDLTARQRLPIIAGGTFFYLDILRGKMQAAPVAPNPALRHQLESEATTDLFQRLSTLSPKRAAMVDTQNRRRIIRAIEIATAIGDFVPPPPAPPSPYRWLVLGCEVPKDELRAHYRARAEAWLSNGFPAEVEGLLAHGVSRGRLNEIGFEYTLMLRLLDGEIDTPTFIDQFEQKNWQYAKRQLTWLKRDPDILWIPPTDTVKAIAVVQEFLDNPSPDS